MKIYNSSLLPLFLVNLFSLNCQLTQVHSIGNETDKVALLKFKEGITSDPHGFFDSWNDSLPFCQWNGITCSPRHQRVRSMVVKGQNLIGFVSPFIGNLSFLRILNLQNNTFKGRIPEQVGNLFRLQDFLLNNNTIDGEIPVNLTRCSQLRTIDLSWNHLAGKIPAEIGSLTMLEELFFSVNHLTGEIPPFLGNLSLLTLLYVGENMLEGSIPNELSKLTRLTDLGVGQNKLYGTIPLSLFNMSSINVIAATNNQLSGNLPNNIGLTLHNLQFLGPSTNLFSGSIPTSVCNASQLEILDVGINNFVGQVPICLGNLPNISWLSFDMNNLGTNSTRDLAFLTSLKNCSNLRILSFAANNFGGVLPQSIANLSSQLRVLYLGSNQITGPIPDFLEKYINLIAVALEMNLFTGNIPFSFGKLAKLQGMFLRGNRLSGQIPSFIGNLTQLSQLDLSRNKFQGSIPASIEHCSYLQALDISQNNLTGSIPEEVLRLSSLATFLDLSHNSLSGDLSADVGKLININKLDVSENNLSGEIPGTISSCSSLEYLYIQGNSFSGTIPSSLASLKGLQQLDFSRNNLTGEIPDSLQSLRFLSYLNLSFNDLAGEIPTGGVFRNASALSLMGNNRLCGGVPQLHQPKCPMKAIKKGKSIHFKLAIAIPCAAFCLLFVLLAILAYQRRESRKRWPAATEEMGRLIQVSYGDLYRATSGFSMDNLIGSGSFGCVYKGFLNQLERQVAIKVLKLEIYGASKSLMAESNVLRIVRHRNLVKLLTYCSSIDYRQNEFKALVFEFMGNGNLENWLHNRNNQSRNLNILQRLNIAIDIASALHYLHDLCEIQIIHCDLKPSNVLLDDEMVAHVSDFGLAKLFKTNNDQSQSHTSSIGIKGTFGYVPPEYGMGSEASKEGDVYSYGILLLEMFTGKRPTDQSFQEHFNLHNFVKDALPSRLADIMDPSLLPTELEEVEIHQREISNHGNPSQISGKEKECLVSVFEVGVACSTELPQERMKMGDVAKELHLIRSNILGVRIYG